MVTAVGDETEAIADMEVLEKELKELIVESLMLEDVTAADIDAGQPLFVDGLGLDSIDALELAMAVERRFGVKFSADDDHNREIFASVRSLAGYVSQTVQALQAPEKAEI